VSTMVLNPRSAHRVPVLNPQPDKEPDTPHEVIRAKEKLAKESAKTKNAGECLRGLLIENGITLRIYVAAGGKHHNA